MAVMAVHAPPPPTRYHHLISVYSSPPPSPFTKGGKIFKKFKNPPPKTVQDNCGSYPPKQARFPQWASSCSLPSTTRHREALEGDKPPSANTRGHPTPPRTRSLAPSLLHSSFPLILKGREARCPVHPPSSFQPTSLPHRRSIFQDNGLTGAGRM